jgi:crossover junction endodeoxyribonuclease RusA
MTRTELTFTVYGEPAPQGSKRIGRHGQLIEASKKVRPWRKAVADAVFREFVTSGDARAFTEPVVVWVTFFLPRPKSVKRLMPAVAPDLDKLCRSLGDGMSIDSNVLTDDSLIVEWHAQKLYADTHPAGAHVVIRLASADILQK